MIKLALGWLGVLFFLFLYSFTQIDLGLTLTRASFWQPIQKNFQLIGYFNRPLSTGFYLLILGLLFVFYFLHLRGVHSATSEVGGLKKVKKGQLTRKQIWRLIFLTAGILWFAYNAFSHDLFNYIFYGKIMTFYHRNPYFYKALDFPGDPMLGFMHWTHNVYPYGPIWLAISAPISFLGFQKLVPTMILFKGLAVGSYLASCWFIEKILAKINPKTRLFGLVVFAFSPLVIIESLVSAHNDILMMMLALAAFWFLIKRQLWLAWLTLFLSIGIKFTTGLLMPVFVLVTWQQWRGKEIDWDKIWWTSLLLMIAAFAAAVYRIKNIQPWYLLYPLPFVALLAKKPLFWLTGIFSLGLLLIYAPFLYLGNWNPPVPAINNWLTFGFLGLGIIVCLLQRYGKIKW